MRRVRFVINVALLVLLTRGILSAQDPQFSQYYQVPLYLNPGFAGVSEGHRFIVNNRVQWPGLPQAFTTYAASYDLYKPDLRSGFGMQFTSDKMGSAGWTSTTVNVLYSYKINLTKDLILSPGFSYGYGTNGLDRSKVRMADGLQYAGASLDPELNKVARQHYFDFSSGVVLYNRQMWIGTSFMHMNRPNLSVVGEVSRLSVKTSVHGGVKIPLKSKFRADKGRYLSPSFIYKVQGSIFTQLDLGLNFHVDPVSVGIWYRGKPYRTSIDNTIDNEAMIVYTGLYLKRLTVGYSYDFTLSSLSSAPGGAHELSIAYQFKSRSSRNKSYNKLIPCPAFYEL